MRQSDGQVVKPVVLTGFPLLCRRDLQEQSLCRNLHRRHGDAILVGEIADRFDIGVAGVEVDFGVGDGRDGLDANPAPGAVPHQRQRGHALGGEMQVAREDRIDDHRGSRKLGPAHFQVAEPARLRLFFDELHILHGHQGDKDGAKLLRQRDFFHLLAGRRTEPAGEQDHTHRQRKNHLSHCTPPLRPLVPAPRAPDRTARPCRRSAYDPAGSAPRSPGCNQSHGATARWLTIRGTTRIAGKDGKVRQVRLPEVASSVLSLPAMRASAIPLQRRKTRWSHRAWRQWHGQTDQQGCRALRAALPASCACVACDRQRRCVSSGPSDPR